jgi:hypothetical protein
MVVDAGFGPHRKELMSKTITFKSLRKSTPIETLAVDDVPPTHIHMSHVRAWDDFGQEHRAVLFIIGKRRKRYVGGFMVRDYLGWYFLLPSFHEYTRDRASLFCYEHKISHPRGLTKVRATTRPENVTPESTTIAQPEPPNVGEGVEPPSQSTTDDDRPDPDGSVPAEAGRLRVADGADQPPPVPRPEVDFEALASKLVVKGYTIEAAIIRHFKNRDTSTWQAVNDAVTPNQVRDWNTIKTWVNRVKNALIEIDPGCPLSFRTSQRGHMVIKNPLPE